MTLKWKIADNIWIKIMAEFKMFLSGLSADQWFKAQRMLGMKGCGVWDIHSQQSKKIIQLYESYLIKSESCLASTEIHLWVRNEENVPAGVHVTRFSKNMTTCDTSQCFVASVSSICLEDEGFNTADLGHNANTCPIFKTTPPVGKFKTSRSITCNYL